MKQIALVTGAGRGVGRVTAITLAKKGWTVVVAGRDKSAIDAVAKEAGGESVGIVCDVSNPESVKSLFTEIKSKFGRLDLLFNNAGVVAPGVALEDVKIEDWQNVVNVNISGVFYCTQQAFALMKTQKPMGGRIINNGSISAHVPRPNSSAYTASKHAVTGLTKTASLDGRHFDIAVGQIDIGNANTDMAEQMRVGATQPDGSKMIEPTIDPQNVADAVVYMASLPLSANVPFITVMATKMPYTGRG
ncbi:MAG: SDR family NAD(P)-dependent oxidoreductase [Actinobacteria bacterium]|nr:SDR family NAD(P)-dependent oxidoreductase [Actinomycetota bacterium]